MADISPSTYAKNKGVGRSTVYSWIKKNVIDTTIVNGKIKIVDNEKSQNIQVSKSSSHSLVKQSEKIEKLESIVDKLCKRVQELEDIIANTYKTIDKAKPALGGVAKLSTKSKKACKEKPDTMRIPFQDRLEVVELVNEGKSRGLTNVDMDPTGSRGSCIGRILNREAKVTIGVCDQVEIHLKELLK